MIYILYVLFLIPIILFWNLLHEFSHLGMARIFTKFKSWSIIPYPHYSNNNFYFARSTYSYEEELNPIKKALISLAPRIPNIIAVLFILLSFFIIPINYLMLLYLGGAVDLIVGSLGINEKSDLKKVANNLNINPWILRIPGLIVGILSLVFGVIKIFIQL
jgi:hypothetical protein